MIAYGLVGHPLGHSCSAAVHACFGDYEYRLYDMDEAALKRLLLSREFLGLNVTIPYKKTVMPYCDAFSAAAQAIGSVNTLYFRDGRLIGDNTDWIGLNDMLARGGISLAGKKTVILGSGGTSVTAQYVAQRNRAREIVVVSRTGENNYERLYEAHTDAEVLINTTPVGMYPGTEETPVRLERFTCLSGVADVIYNPAKTLLLREAEKRGIPCVGGEWMLARQGLESARLFLGKDLPGEWTANAVEAIRRMLKTKYGTGE